MTAFTVRIDISDLLPPQRHLGSDAFPHLASAVHEMVLRGQQLWQAYAAGAALPDGRKIRIRSGGYEGSIHTRQTGPFEGEIFSDAPHADALERGMPPRDLKRMLDSSLKVRISKAGKRYLIIPFRHGTPDAVTLQSVMPPEVHDLWRGLRKSRVLNTGMRASGTGALDIRTRNPVLVPARNYRWGDRLTVTQLNAAGVHGERARRMQGMVHFQNPSGRGGGKHGQYLTFRIMTEGSRGWLTKGTPGYWPARTTAEQLRPQAERVFAKSVALDVEQALAGS